MKSCDLFEPDQLLFPTLQMNYWKQLRLNWTTGQKLLHIAKNPVSHGKTKLVNVKFHLVREAE